MSYGGILKVISGGQTGADQGGLLAAWERCIPTGGWAPANYRTITGPCHVLEVLGLQQTDSRGYSDRTLRNVEEGDVTLIFGHDLTSPGSRQTADDAAKVGKPFFKFEFPLGTTANVKEIPLIEAAVDFILQHRPLVVNVAGNRDTAENDANFRSTRRVFGLILDLVKERLRESR